MRDNVTGQWNHLEDRPFTQSERKFNDHSNDITKAAIIEGCNEPRD